MREQAGMSASLFPDLAAEAPGEAESSAGILPSQRIRWLIQAGHLSASAPFDDDQVQPASIDLRLGALAYRVRASFLPNRASIRSRLELFSSHAIDLRSPTVLERGCVYIVPALEDLNLPRDISAKANPKSTIGRLDVFTRLITDYGTEFEQVPAGYKGRLYLEIVPRTFSILVAQGSRLSQLRFWRGSRAPSDAKLAELHAAETLVSLEDDAPAEPFISRGLWVSVDLSGGEVVGYRARRYAPPVDLARVAFYDPTDFWEPIVGHGSIILDPDEFHLLVSRERVRIPPAYAAEMVGYEPTVGEFRVHYAGFFDPGFGYGSADPMGARAVLEVRSHEVPFVLEHGQRVARLIFERLQSVPDRLYGPAIGSSYQFQGLSLSKQFRQPGKPG
jgi:dCTP deaminase